MRRACEAVFAHPEGDAAIAQLVRQVVVHVEVNLQRARQPCWHAHIHQAVFLVDEVEVKHRALARAEREAGPAVGSLRARFVGHALFHRLYDVHQAGVASAAREHRLHKLLLAARLAAYELNRRARLPRKRTRVFVDLVGQRLRVVADVVTANAGLVELRLHRPRMRHLAERPVEQHTVEALQHPVDLSRVPLHQSAFLFHARHPITPPRFPPALGSGFAGLGDIELGTISWRKNRKILILNPSPLFPGRKGAGAFDGEIVTY